MDWSERMNAAVDYIEENLAGEINFNEAAKRAFCSIYHFHRMFSGISGITPGEYCRQRRLTLAAKELLSSTAKVIDIATKYGYDSPSAFAKAFRNQHGATPKEARECGMPPIEYPRISFPVEIRGGIDMDYFQGGFVDIKETIKTNLKNCLVETDLEWIGPKKRGKVRDTYDAGDKIVLVTTDRQSAFDRILASVPFKGAVLNLSSAWWFTQTEDIVPNHVLAVPDPNVTIGRKCSVFPVEFVIRGFLTGVTDTAVWTAYEKGEREFCGNILPEGMKKNQKFSQPIITPTTKFDEHDLRISAEEIVSEGLMSQEDWDTTSELTRKLFARGQELAAQAGLILVDTKYEFGRDDSGNIVLIDEIHTPDSSRWWFPDSYEERFTRGEEPEYFDKEFLRLWFREHCDPYEDKELPAAPDELVIELASRYIDIYEGITGEAFGFTEGDINDRIDKNLEEYFTK